MSACLIGCTKEETRTIPAGELFNRVQAIREGIVNEDCKFGLTLVRATSKDPMNVVDACYSYEKKSAQYLKQIRTDLNQGNDRRAWKNIRKMNKISKSTIIVLDKNMSMFEKELKLR